MEEPRSKPLSLVCSNQSRPKAIFLFFFLNSFEAKLKENFCRCKKVIMGEKLEDKKSQDYTVIN